jgi:prepilin-type N-terminal cleavage/methylation domain-containing protein
MRRTPTDRPARRGGFTLVELLVVITILAILFALTAAAVVKAMGTGDTVRVRSEISQLAQAVQAFKTQFQVPYVPDRIVLPPGYDATTQQYFKSVWPRLNAATLGTGTATFQLGNPAQTYTVFSYWGVSGTAPVMLQGDQALVFFLGGKYDPSTKTCYGFSTDGTNPLQNNVTGSRHGPFYDFPPDRLAVFSSGGTTTEVTGLLPRSPSFPSFKDIYGSTPYLYFSSNKAGNDYDYLFNSVYKSTQLTTNGFAMPVPASSPTAYSLVLPFQLNATRFANPNGFQIISAGKDTTFGKGASEWVGYAGGGASMVGADDMANFHPNTLGVPAQ